MTKVVIVVAHDEDRGIGLGNAMPWHLPEELTWLRRVTSSVQEPKRVNALLMGRKTWDSVPEQRRPLRDRLNIVVSSGLLRSQQGCVPFSSLDDALSFAVECGIIETVFIFGGGTIYRQVIERRLVDEIFATEIHRVYSCDTVFPVIPPEFRLLDESADVANGVSLTRRRYIKMGE